MKILASSLSSRPERERKSHRIAVPKAVANIKLVSHRSARACIARAFMDSIGSGIL